jgi:amino acid transporter
MLAMVMGLTTLVGFDVAANLAEEAKDFYRSVPRAIVGKVLAASLLALACIPLSRENRRFDRRLVLVRQDRP